MPGRDVDIDGALGRIAQQVVLEDLALDRYPADCPGRADKSAHLKRLLLASFGTPHNRVEQSMPHGSGLGTVGCVVEHANAWLLANKRLDRRNDRLTNIIDALLTTACIFVIANRLTD